MKHILLTTVAAVVLVGCVTKQLQKTKAIPIQQPEPTTAKAPDISIHSAAMGSFTSPSGNIEAVKQHLAAGTDVNAKNKSGTTPLHIAALYGHKEVAELLIAKGADVNAKTKSGNTPLDKTINFNRTEIADLIRKHGGKRGEELEAEESIHAAARYGNIEAIKQHLAAGADVNANNVGGVTPLHWAAQEGQKEIAELLIAKGASVNAQDVGGYTPLDSAIRWNYTEISDLLRKHGGKTGKELKPAKPEPTTAKAPDISIHDAAERGNIKAVKQHLAAGTDVNAKDIFGCTPLHFAAENGRKEIVERLIAVGAEVNAERDDGCTPFHFAAANDRKEVAEMLIAAGADVNAKTKYGSTPLDWAIRFDETETADLLRKHGGKTGDELK